MLKAAAHIVGGDAALAARLGISETLLSKFVADSIELPDALLLRAADIILEERQSRLRLPGGPSLQPWPQGPALIAGSGD